MQLVGIGYPFAGIGDRHNYLFPVLHRQSDGYPAPLLGIFHRIRQKVQQYLRELVIVIAHLQPVARCLEHQGDILSVG